MTHNPGGILQLSMDIFWQKNCPGRRTYYSESTFSMAMFSIDGMIPVVHHHHGHPVFTAGGARWELRLCDVIIVVGMKPDSNGDIITAVIGMMSRPRSATVSPLGGTFCHCEGLTVPPHHLPGNTPTNQYPWPFVNNLWINLSSWLTYRCSRARRGGDTGSSNSN